MTKKKTVLSHMPSLTPNEAPPATEKNTIEAAPLAAILPDPGQPRRLLPEDLAAAVASATLSPADALHLWLGRAESDAATTAVRRTVRELKRLAASIAQHGLISPITVRLPYPEEFIPPGITYFIVTGERRYWAHIYLLSQGQQIQAGDSVTSPAEIRISLAPAGITIRAYQLIENLLREDLNALERARGLWALRYELSGVNYSSPPTDQLPAAEDSPTPTEGAEVNDSSPSLLPWTRVEEVLGISKRYRIYLTSVLQLSPVAQALVATHNLAEMTIRPITQKLKDKPELQLQALRQLIEWQNAEEDEGPGQSLVTSIKEFVDQLLVSESDSITKGETTAPKRVRAVSSAPVLRFRDKVRQALDFLSRLKQTDRAELTQALQRGDYADVMLDLRLLREELDTFLRTIPPTVEPTMTAPSFNSSDTIETNSAE
jgi:hypothetical protein